GADSSPRPSATTAPSRLTKRAPASPWIVTRTACSPPHAHVANCALGLPSRYARATPQYAGFGSPHQSTAAVHQAFGNDSLNCHGIVPAPRLSVASTA